MLAGEGNQERERSDPKECPDVEPVPEAEQQQIRANCTPERDRTRRQPTQMQRQQQIADKHREQSGEHPSRAHLVQRGGELVDPA